MIILLFNSGYDYRADIALLRWQKISWTIITFWMTTVPGKGEQRGDDGRNNMVSLLLR